MITWINTAKDTMSIFEGVEEKGGSKKRQMHMKKEKSNQRGVQEEKILG
jgi:hypothetical protein